MSGEMGNVGRIAPEDPLARREKRPKAHRHRFGGRRETRREAVAVWAADQIVKFSREVRQNRDALFAVITHLLA
jgi:hypothetical protein